MSIGVNKPFIDFTDAGGDTGQGNAASVLPYANGEDLVEAVLNRPVDLLRKRTEVLRNFLDDALYLREADRHLVLGGPGQIAWAGASPGQSGILTLSANLYLVPFLTPGNSGNSPPIGSTYGTIGLTKSGGGAGLVVTSQRRNYEGGNKFSIKVVAGSVAAAAIAGTPPRNVTVTAAPATTLGAVITLLNALLDEQGTAPFAAALAGGAGSGDIITQVQAQQYISGNWDAEGHVLTPAAFASFFATPANVLKEGDTLAVWYAALVEDAGSPSPLGALGGRRQSIPENSNTTVPAGSLFNSRVHPERLLNAIPICKVINGELVLIDGTTLVAGDSGIGVGQTSASGIEYAGGPNWADVSTNPATTVEAQLDKIITDLANTSNDGPAKIHALANGIFMSTGTLRAQLNQLDAALNGIVNNAAPLTAWLDTTTIPATTLIAQLNRIIHDLADTSADAAARLHGAASGSLMSAGSLRAQLNQLDAAIALKGPLTLTAKAVGAVRWNGSAYSLDWGVGLALGAPTGSAGVVNMSLSNPPSSTTTGAIFVTGNATPGTATPYIGRGLLGGGGATAQAELYNAAGTAMDGSFYIVVFGA